tara:strand:- start:603 stop:932 length:330 start_codon:yes stop_codon:yes gene_type:complete
MYEEKNSVKYICKCGGGLNSHENVNNIDECICNVKSVNNNSNVNVFDSIVSMLSYHKKNSIQPFSVIYLNDNDNIEKDNMHEERKSICENGNSKVDTISNIVDRLWNHK